MEDLFVIVMSLSSQPASPLLHYAHICKMMSVGGCRVSTFVKCRISLDYGRPGTHFPRNQNRDTHSSQPATFEACTEPVACSDWSILASSQYRNVKMVWDSVFAASLHVDCVSPMLSLASDRLNAFKSMTGTLPSNVSSNIEALSQ